MKKNWMKNLLLCLVSVFCGVFIFEIGVRVLDVKTNISFVWNYHPVLGWSQVPDGQYDFKYEEEPVHIEFNSLGFRDVEHVIKKPEGTKRIVLIGDSFSEAVQVNLNETFYKRLEKMLNKSGGETWEIINLGVGDFGTAQEWIAFSEYGLKYEPDIVIHQIFPLNDICNNSIELYDLCKSENDRYRPYFKESAGGLNLSSKQPVRNFLRRYLVSYGVAERYILEHMEKAKHHGNDEYRKKYLEELGFPPLDILLNTYSSDEKQIKEVKKAWRITEKTIQKISDLCKDSNVEYIPVVIPFVGRLDKIWKDVLAQNPNQPTMRQRYPEERLGDFFEKNGIESVMMLDTFQANEDLVLPYRDGHLNPEGHRLTAESLYKKIGGW